MHPSLHGHRHLKASQPYPSLKLWNPPTMVRTACFDETGKKKGEWSPEEDDALVAYIRKHGHSNWRQLPKLAGLQRCGKSCRLRWLNYLRPDVIRGNYTKEEEDIIVTLREKLGNKWSVIASMLPGRTDNGIKNHWHAHLKKRIQGGMAEGEVETVSDHRNKVEEGVVLDGVGDNVVLRYPSLKVKQSSSPSDISSSGDSGRSHESNSTGGRCGYTGGDFWTEPFLKESVDYSMEDSCVMEEFMMSWYSSNYTNGMDMGWRQTDFGFGNGMEYGYIGM